MKILTKIKNIFAKKKNSKRDKEPTHIGRWITINGNKYHCLMIEEEEEK